MLNAKSSVAILKNSVRQNIRTEIVMVAFDIKTAVRRIEVNGGQPTDISDMGETMGDMFSVRIATSDFTPPPAEKDI